MARRVAVSDSLSPLKQMLHRAGYDVVNLENEAVLSETGMSEYDAVVVSGRCKPDGNARYLDGQ